MTVLNIPAHERNTCRVFALRLTPPEVRRLRTGDADDALIDPVAIAALLGSSIIDAAHVEIFDVAVLADVGLTTFLTQGNGIAEVAIEADRGQLDAVEGYVLILYSKAFAGEAATLHLDPALTLIGTYAEDLPPVRFEPLPSAAATGVLPGSVKPPMSDARIGGMVATVALLVMFALAALMVWIGG